MVIFTKEEKKLLISHNLDPKNVSYNQVYKILHSSSSTTIPTITNHNITSKIEHEASSSQISEEILFYLQSRGIVENDATGLIVNGFCKEIFTQLPMEFLIEAQKLVDIEMQGSVG
jgi:Fe-S cluster assembly scaffold protein SufB